MSKFLGFSFLWWFFGNPLIAIIVMLLILYFIDRRFIGLSPSMMRPIRRMQRISKLNQGLSANPHDTSAKLELAHLLIERRHYSEARKWLEPLQDRMDQSAEYWDDLGTCYLYTGETERGEAAIRYALQINPRVKYGQPYLRLAKHYAAIDKQKAIALLEEFGGIHSSSCEGYYRMGILYAEIGRKKDAKDAWEETIRIYRSSPKYVKRKERAWMIKSRIKLLTAG
ncbi:tetratricopeptide repeat protein [Paenibacillus marinisediminis]